ncbi:mothers against decapentaplegic 6-like isoform X1 [Leptotrombidium deliense]|uniref:Mothers against decapentaplegic homolog n=1 Tax=Leptotrombidium deliense TaxID=299467 RepID=A0A443SWF2_9ACAR|nr:mothers against decapentaplegic 6-like isoform X1 [Leptotrombidium deliense]
MFRSKRGSLLNALWQRSRDHSDRDGDTASLKSVAFAMLAPLSEHQLRTLLEAIDSKGGERSPCVFVNNSIPDAQVAAPQLLACRLWRWPQVLCDEKLKCLLFCRTRDSCTVCINPYHWSRIAKAESIECVSADKHCPDTVSWCEIAYWELNERIGRLFPVYESSINVFTDLPHGSGFCLKNVDVANKRMESVITRTHNKIGFGIMISREGDSVWVYNRSKYPVFLNSHTLDPPTVRRLTVHKILPGYSIQAFDYEKVEKYLPVQEKIRSEEGPFDPYTIRISFAKGWGPKYSRQSIMSCPCWLEVILVRR